MAKVAELVVGLSLFHGTAIHEPLMKTGGANQLAKCSPAKSESRPGSLMVVETWPSVRQACQPGTLFTGSGVRTVCRPGSRMRTLSLNASSFGTTLEDNHSMQIWAWLNPTTELQSLCIGIQMGFVCTSTPKLGFTPCKKGTSLKTKALFLIIKDLSVVKFRTHDMIGKAIGYAMDVLGSGAFPYKDFDGNDFKPGTVEAARAGHRFAGPWSLCFAGFKSDLEARVVVHKFLRNYQSKHVCERCPASREREYSFGDFRPEASHRAERFSQEEFVRQCSDARVSAWTHVRGWTIDRNLEEA